MPLDPSRYGSDRGGQKMGCLRSAWNIEREGISAWYRRLFVLVPFAQGDTSAGSIELDYAVLQYRCQVFNIYAVAVERSQVKRLALDGGDA